MGSEFQVNAFTTGNQSEPAVASVSSGSFVVVWSGVDGGPDAAGGPYGYGSSGIIAQRFDAAGHPVGSEFQVNTYTTGRQSQPSVASAPNGDFVVVWTSHGDGGAGSYNYYTGTSHGRLWRRRPALRGGRGAARGRVPGQHLYKQLPGSFPGP